MYINIFLFTYKRSALKLDFGSTIHCPQTEIFSIIGNLSFLPGKIL